MDLICSALYMTYLGFTVTYVYSTCPRLFWDYQLNTALCNSNKLPLLYHKKLTFIPPVRDWPMVWILHYRRIYLYFTVTYPYIIMTYLYRNCKCLHCVLSRPSSRHNDGDHQYLHTGGPVCNGDFATGPETETLSTGETGTGEAISHLGGWTHPLQYS